MNFKILLLKMLMVLNFLICVSRFFHSFIVDRKKDLLKESCFVRSWGIFAEFCEEYLVFGDWILHSSLLVEDVVSAARAFDGF